MWKQLKGAGLSILEQLAGDLLNTIGGAVLGTAEHLAQVGARWLIRLALSKIIGAILGVTALVFLLTAASLGVQALGVHPAIANLGAGIVVAGIGAWFFFYAGNRSFSDELSDEVEEHAGEAAGPKTGISIRFERPEASRRKRTKSKKKVYDVHPDGDDRWELRSSRGRKRRFGTKKAAVAAAKREASRHEPSRVVVHKEDGTFEQAS